jgi:hypothetical protein
MSPRSIMFILCSVYAAYARLQWYDMEAMVLVIFILFYSNGSAALWTLADFSGF